MTTYYCYDPETGDGYPIMAYSLEEAEAIFAQFLNE